MRRRREPPASGTAGGGGEDPVIPDASAQDMEVDAPAGGGAHMETEELAAQGEPELLIVASPIVTTAGQQADPAGSAAGQRQPGEPVVLEEDAATAAGREQQHEPPQQQQQQQGAPAPQPGAGAGGGASSAGAGDIVVSGASSQGYLPETLERIAREWEATNRKGLVLDVQGPANADGYAALVPEGEELNPGRLHNLFGRTRTELNHAFRRLTVTEEYAAVSYMISSLQFLLLSGIFTGL